MKKLLLSLMLVFVSTGCCYAFGWGTPWGDNEFSLSVLQNRTTDLAIKDLTVDDVVADSITADTFTFSSSVNGMAWQLPRNTFNVSVVPQTSTDYLIYQQDGLVMSTRTLATPWTNANGLKSSVIHTANTGLSFFASVDTWDELYSALGMGVSGDIHDAFDNATDADAFFPFVPMYQIQETEYPTGYNVYEYPGYVFPSGIKEVASFTQRFVEYGAESAPNIEDATCLTAGGYYPSEGYKRWIAKKVQVNFPTTRKVDAGALSILNDGNSQGVALIYYNTNAGDNFGSLSTAPLAASAPLYSAATAYYPSALIPTVQLALDRTVNLELFVNATINLSDTVGKNSAGIVFGFTSGITEPQEVATDLAMLSFTTEPDGADDGADPDLKMYLYYIKNGGTNVRVDLSAYFTDNTATTYRIVLTPTGQILVYINGTVRHASAEGAASALSTWGETIPIFSITNSAGAGTVYHAVSITDLVLKNN